MKRYGNLYKQIYNLENLELADKKARKGKTKTKEVLEFTMNRNLNLFVLYETLKNNNYKTSEYKIFKLYDPKEREIYKLPYYPDRIVHHAIKNKKSIASYNGWLSYANCINLKRKYLKDEKTTSIR